MSNRIIYDFLRDLTNNNSKEWMDEHRDLYNEARKHWIDQVSQILKRLEKYNPKFGTIDPKKTIMRINNNRMFHPDKPIYKDNFAFSPFGMDEAAIYVHISPNNSFMGGGLHHPDSKTLKKLRAAFDYDGAEFKKIITTPEFEAFYGGLSADEQELKTSPRGYSEDHEHIDLLRRKNFTAIRSLTQKEVNSSDFIDIVEEGYKALIPFNAYLQKAIDFEI
jgi:uncharacterized protein (TIGR02453 family)